MPASLRNLLARWKSSQGAVRSTGAFVCSAANFSCGKNYTSGLKELQKLAGSDCFSSVENGIVAKLTLITGSADDSLGTTRARFAMPFLFLQQYFSQVRAAGNCSASPIANGFAALRRVDRK
jgi:hypothetical protein